MGPSCYLAQVGCRSSRSKRRKMACATSLHEANTIWHDTNSLANFHPFSCTSTTHSDLHLKDNSDSLGEPACYLGITRHSNPRNRDLWSERAHDLITALPGSSKKDIASVWDQRSFAHLSNETSWVVQYFPPDAHKEISGSHWKENRCTLRIKLVVKLWFFGGGSGVVILQMYSKIVCTIIGS